MESIQTFGERAVGLNFNPSGSPAVDKVKTKFSEIIDILNKMRVELPSDNLFSSEKARLLSVAITECQTAQMWAVKGIVQELQ